MHTFLDTRLIMGSVLLASSLGCGPHEGSAASKASVSGTVTYQNKPLSEGRIVFLHDSGQAVGTDIGIDGSFHLDAYVGPNRISIVSLGPDIPNPSGRPAVLPGKSLIPVRYGEFETSGLTIDVQPDGDTIAFDLEGRSQ